MAGIRLIAVEGLHAVGRVSGRGQAGTPMRKIEPASLAAAALIVAATVAVYHRVGAFPFVFDDYYFLQLNPLVARGLTGEGVRRAFTEMYGANWQPLTTLLYMANVTLFGSNAGAHHLVSLLLHTLASIGLFLVLQRLTGRFWPPAFVAALFAIHPVHVESVAWVTEAKDPLSAIFWLLGIAAWTRYAARPGAGRYAAAAGFFALGLMSKPIVITLPLVLMLLDWWPLGRLGGAAPGKTAPLRLMLEKVPLLALAGASAVVTILSQRTVGALASVDDFSPAARLANAIVSCVAYLGDSLWPSGLAVFYPFPLRGTPLLQVAGAATLLSLIMLATWLLRRRQPWLLAGWAWFLVTLLPVIGLVQVGGQTRADRYLYLPLIGLGVMAAWAAPGLARRTRLGTPTLSAAAVAALAVLAIVAEAQTAHWRSPETLWQRALATTEDNWVAHKNYAVDLYAAGRPAEALEHLREAARLRPRATDIQLQLANMLYREHRTAEAIRQFRVAIGLDSGLPEPRYRIGQLLEESGDLVEARATYREALRLDPGHSRAAAALVRIGPGRR